MHHCPRAALLFDICHGRVNGRQSTVNRSPAIKYLDICVIYFPDSSGHLYIFLTHQVIYIYIYITVDV